MAKAKTDQFVGKSQFGAFTRSRSPTKSYTSGKTGAARARAQAPRAIKGGTKGRKSAKGAKGGGG